MTETTRHPEKPASAELETQVESPPTQYQQILMELREWAQESTRASQLRNKVERQWMELEMSLGDTPEEDKFILKKALLLIIDYDTFKKGPIQIDVNSQHPANELLRKAFQQASKEWIELQKKQNQETH